MAAGGARGVAAVAAAAVGLLVAGLVGYLLGFAVSTAVGIVLADAIDDDLWFRIVPGWLIPASVVVGALAGVWAGGYLLAGRVVPRVAGGRHRRLPVDRARGLVAAAAAVVGVLFGLYVAVFDRPVVVGLVVGLAIAAAGAAGARHAQRRQAGRVGGLAGRMRDEHGGVSGEYVGVVVVVAAVVSALVAVPLAPTVGAWARYAVCSLFAGDCERPDGLGAGGPQASGEPAFACERHRATRGLNINVSLAVGVDRNVDYDLSLFSHGQAHLFYRQDAAGSAGIGGGVQADLYWGEGRLTLGVHASGSAGLRVGEGETFVWSGPDAERSARHYGVFHAASDGAADLVGVTGGRKGILGPVHRGGARVLNWGVDKLPGVDGLDIREPERRLVHASGGYELEASGAMGWMSEDDGPVDGRIEAALERGVGHTRDVATGEVTVYVLAETGIEAEGRVGGAAGEASWSSESIVAVTVGPDDRLLEARVTTYRVDEAGRDIAGTSDLRAAFPDRRHAAGAQDGGRGGLTRPSLYQVDTRLDLTDPANEELVARVAAGQALTTLPGIAADYAAEFALAPVHEAGTTTIVEYDAVERAYGAELDASAIGEGGAGLVLTADDRSARQAYHFDEGLGRYDRWLSCTPVSGGL